MFSAMDPSEIENRIATPATTIESRFSLMPDFGMTIFAKLSARSGGVRRKSVRGDPRSFSGKINFSSAASAANNRVIDLGAERVHYLIHERAGSGLSQGQGHGPDLGTEPHS
jgi:hypothetical protein